MENQEYFNANDISENTSLFRTSENYLLRVIAGEAVLVPVGDGAGMMNGMISLNETFQFLWEQFREPHTIADVITTVTEEFEGSKEEITRDIHTCVRECLQRGLLIRADV